MSRQQERARERAERKARMNGGNPIPAGGIALEPKKELKQFAASVDEIEPLGNLLIIRIIAQDKTEGGILLPEGHHEEGPRRGEVVGCGPGLLKEDGTFSPNQCQVGDLVYMTFSRHAATMNIGGEPHMIIPDDSVLMKVRRPAE